MDGRVLLFVVPQFLFPAFNRDIARQRGFYAFPPRGLQCLKQALDSLDFGLHVTIADLNFLLLRRISQDDGFSLDRWREIVDGEVERWRPTVIGVGGLTVTADVQDDNHVLTSLFSHLRAKGPQFLLAGGPIVTDERDFFLERGLADIVIAGEGENKIRHVMSLLMGKPPPGPEMKGIYYRHEGEIRESEGGPDIVPASATIIATYDQVAVEEYCRIGSLNPFSRMAGMDKPFATLLLNRGCRADCAFCGVTVFMGKGLRQHAPSHVIDELRFLAKTRGIRHIELLDDDFFGTPALKSGGLEVLAEMKSMREQGLDITWSAGNGLIASSLDMPTLALMRDSGCTGFRIGIESGNLKMLKRMRKPTSLRILRQLSRDLALFPEMLSCGNYIIGLFQEETFAEMLDTFALALSLNLDWSSWAMFQVTNITRAEHEKVTSEHREVTDFIPTKDSASRRLAGLETGVFGPDVFRLDPSLVPGREQIKHIWFAFNLVGNYICNPNLKPGGNAAKLAAWLQAIHVSYPGNAYMPLFRALALTLLGRQVEAEEQRALALSLLASSPYWQQCLGAFDLTPLAENFPTSAAQVFEKLARLASFYEPYFGPSRRQAESQ